MSRGDRRPAGACAALTILCLGILNWYWDFSPLLDLAAAGPLVFYLPGWSVLLALDAEPAGRFASMVLRVALSLAIVVIAGLLLNFADSITRPGWLAALGLITVVACLISLAHGSPAAAAKPALAGQARARLAAYRDISMMTRACGLAAAAIALSYVLAVRHHEFYYTQLWIVPTQDAPESVVIGLRNAERRDQSYAIELLVDHRLVQSWSEVPLKPGETWTTTFRWAGLGEYPRAVQPLRQSTTSEEAARAAISQRVALGASPRVEAIVYRSNNRSVIYRQVWTAPQCAGYNDARGRPPCKS